MNPTVELNPEGIERQPLADFSARAYREYSMYVILDRALPHLGDGLKPVQRRIVYAMSELGLRSGAKFKKSARTVGDVLGKFHPHGDSACYEAMVLLAQPFSTRYPLLEGQGNWGSADDPKSFAAMRYTEVRLAAYADLLLGELGQGTVEWEDNFDGTLREPSLLPARLPNLLLNGTTGIAVGMATDIPPHNLREVADACIHLIDHPEAGVEELCRYIQGPDFPTAAEIVTPAEDLVRTYSTGSGSLRMRAVYHRENGEIVVTALPHQVSGARVLEQIAAQMQARKLPMVVDLRDESDHEDPTRLVIVPRSRRVEVETLMAHLFATTDLERSYRVNFNVIGLDGRPRVMSLVHFLGEWLRFRTATVRRRLEHRLEKVRTRMHLLDGLLTAFLNLDEVIAVIRTQDRPAAVLMDRFGLSEKQAEAILNTRLRHLARIEEMKIRAESDELKAERRQLVAVLKSKQRLRDQVRREIEADVERYGDPRRSPIVVRREARAIAEADMAPVEAVTVVVSHNGWVRAAKGHEVEPDRLNYRAGDRLGDFARGRSNQAAVFLDTSGRTYSLPAAQLPSARGQGEPLTGRLNLPAGARIQNVLMGAPERLVLLASDAGYGFVTRLADLLSKNRSGKAMLTVPVGAQPLPPLEVDDLEADRLLAIDSEGHMLCFAVHQMPVMPRGKGNKIIQIPPKQFREGLERLHRLILVPPESQVVIHAGRRHLTLKPGQLEAYAGQRGRRGRLLPRGLRRVDHVELVQPVQMNIL